MAYGCIKFEVRNSSTIQYTKQQISKRVEQIKNILILPKEEKN